MNTYRVTARVPWGIERYLVSAVNHLSACDTVEREGQPFGQPSPIPIMWEIVSREKESN